MMKAGRELEISFAEALAEHVMDWKRRGEHDSTAPLHRIATILETGKEYHVDDWESKGPHPRLESPDGDTYYFCQCQGRKGDALPAWPTNIAAAWEVVEKVLAEWSDDGFEREFRLHTWDDGSCTAYFGFDYPSWEPPIPCYWHQGQGPAEAICLAALKTKGVEID